jgi:excisionase family DNA binding protein
LKHRVGRGSDAERGARPVSAENDTGKGGEKENMAELLTILEVARVLRVDATTVRRWVKEGTLEAIILPHARERQAYRIKREVLERVLGESVQPVSLS